MAHDYADYITPTSEDALAQLTRLANTQLEVQQEIARTESELKQHQEELKTVAETLIPDLMEELGLETFTTSSGVKVTIKETLRASILAANQAAAFRWLRDNGHEALIKRVLKIQFGMGDDEAATDAIKKLEGLPVEDKSSVHPATLKKFVGELMADGQEVPEDLFSIHRQLVASIKV